MTPLTEQICRQLLLQTWGRQACQRAADWPETLQNLLRGRPHDPKDFDEHATSKNAHGTPAAPCCHGSISPLAA
jgi:hypothetical protein